METLSIVNTVKNRGPYTIILIVAGVVILTVAGIVIIPRLLKKYTNKVYKVFVEKDDIDIENLAPEIIQKKMEE